MKAAVYHGQSDIRLEDVVEPVPGDGELLIAVSSVGICGTDAAEFAKGPTMFPVHHRHDVTGHSGPMIPGHEFAGRVVATGPQVTGFRVGDLVAAGAGVSCGGCASCLAGRTNLCRRYWTVGLQRNGGLAELTTAPASTCLNVEQRSVTSDVAGMAQPMAVAVHAMRRGRPHPGDEVLVLGCGGIGAFLIHAAAKEGAHVTVVDVDAERLRIAGRLGAASTIVVTRDAGLSDQLRDRGLDPTVVYECTGNPSGFDAAMAVCAIGGRVVVVGLHGAPLSVDLRSVTVLEKEIVGTLAHVFGSDFGHAVDLLSDETDLWEQVAPNVIPLEDLVDGGLTPMLTGGATPIKTLLDPRTSVARPIAARP